MCGLWLDALTCRWRHRWIKGPMNFGPVIWTHWLRWIYGVDFVVSRDKTSCFHYRSWYRPVLTNMSFWHCLWIIVLGYWTVCYTGGHVMMGVHGKEKEECVLYVHPVYSLLMYASRTKISTVSKQAIPISAGKGAFWGGEVSYQCFLFTLKGFLSGCFLPTWSA